MSQGFARQARIGVDLHVGETLYYTADDTFAKADYPGLYGVRVKVQGAGGGGSGTEATAAGEVNGGGGGGSGAYAESIVVAVDLGTSETVTVGAGGAGGIGNTSGSAGEASSFGTHVVAGAGSGGEKINSRSTHAMPAGGVGGAATAGDLQVDGSPGDRGILLEGVTGAGGNGGVSVLGGGGLGGANSNGEVGGSFGGGGGGAGANPSQSSFNGGDGGAGIVIVEVLYERKIAVDEDIHPQYLLEADAPLGTLGYAEVTADQLAITTEADITGLSVTVDVDTGRRIRITGSHIIKQEVSAAVVTAYIKEGATYLGRWAMASLGINEYVRQQASVVLAPSSGSHTYKLSIETSAGNIDLLAASTYPAFILVEDIGPA